MIKTKDPIKVDKEWVKVLEGEGFVTFNKLSRVYYSYGEDEPKENFNRARDINKLKGYANSPLWVKAVNEPLVVTPNVYEEEVKKEEKQETKEQTTQDKKDKDSKDEKANSTKKTS